jgi:hypothetical protein
MEASHLDIVRERFSQEAMSITETEATPATGTIETTTGIETITGTGIEAGIEVTIAIEIGIAAVAEPRIGTTTEITTTAEIQDLRIIETTAVVEIRGQMRVEATQVIGEVVAQEVMFLAQHLRETEIVEQKLQAPHREDVRTIGERKY